MGGVGRGLGHDRIIASWIRSARDFGHANRSRMTNTVPGSKPDTARRRPAYHRAMALEIHAADPRPHPRPRDAVRPGWRPEVVLVRLVPGPRAGLDQRDGRRKTASSSTAAATERRTTHRDSSRTTDDAVVGWVSLGPREDYERLAFSKVLAPLDDKAVWSIVCFVVGRRSRGQGVAGGPPRRRHRLRPRPRRDDPRGVPGRRRRRRERIPSANAFHGTLGMFERAGFKVVARRKGSPNATPRPIVANDPARPVDERCADRHRPAYVIRRGPAIVIRRR